MTARARPAAALAALIVASVLGPALAGGSDRVALIQRYIDTNVRPWLHDPSILSALRRNNALHAALDDDSILFLDGIWREERASGQYKLIAGVLSDPASALLKLKSETSFGVITEIILMDSRGLNAAVSGIPSDYWQGDEEKFQKSFEAGPDALFIDEPEKDDSTQILQSQASLTIDDDQGRPIGAITIGINLDYL